jgi:1-deoxy-D-xylulose-5-phosphate reductoisomerase
LQKKNIAILGSTGSIGVQALEVIAEHPDLFAADVLTANNNVDLLIAQALQYKPRAVCIGNEAKYGDVADALRSSGVEVHAGTRAIADLAALDSVDLVLSAMVGFAGLVPTLNAVRHGKDIALANKESLVVAGRLIMEEAKHHQCRILPVDSEHSAIYQCLVGEASNTVEKLILTASGGPFRGKSRSELEGVTVEQALRHPNWDMGAKITIDSATLMNKGLEVIEARWLFGMQADDIDVVVHPQSIIHSMVQFEDGSIKAQLGLPDMRLPIQYAFSFPQRVPSGNQRFDFRAYPRFTFEQPDTDTFRNLYLAYQSLINGGNMPCILNAANEVAVQAFLENKISFLQIPDLIETAMATVNHLEQPDLDDLLETDKIAREKALDRIE